MCEMERGLTWPFDLGGDVNQNLTMPENRIEEKVWYDGALGVDKDDMKEPAMTFKFPLDNFQKQAIAALEKDHNVFVQAHTSAGKTVVAEYAIALALKNKTRIIYTSPIKALSNQKYHDFDVLFKDQIGLITGDIKMNEDADCLVMTTEILLSMLYNSSESLNILEFVIFDEVHYLSDPSRGHVWEECLILLPSNVKIIMLSATVPNVEEFCTWIGRIKKRLVAICSTTHRPVPLKHYLYVENDQRNWHIQNFSSLIKIGDAPIVQKEYLEMLRIVATVKMWKKRSRDEILTTLIYQLARANLMPVVVFVFSCNKCDALASSCLVDLTTKEEKIKISSFIAKQVDQLEKNDQTLRQVKTMEKLFQRGIGVHHSGILPILKEMAEYLFQDGLVKILFATETFATGLNMPARTVVFSAIEKFDGTNKRLLLPSEYLQMAGRAGRRGKDVVGNVFIVNKPEATLTFESLKTVLDGKITKLTSKLKISYRMILMILAKQKGMTFDDLMAKSFQENDLQINRDENSSIYEKLNSDCDKYETQVDQSMAQELKSVLSQFYDKADDYFQSWYLEKTMKNPSEIETKLTIEEGRYVNINFKNELNKIGIVIIVRVNLNKIEYVVFTLDSSRSFYDEIAPKTPLQPREIERWYKIQSLLPYFTYPNFIERFKVVTIKPIDIFEIYDKKIKKEEVQVLINELRKNSKFIHESGPTDMTGYVDRICKKIKSENIHTLKSHHDGKKDLTMLEQKKQNAVDIGNEISYKDFQAHFEKIFLWKESTRKVDEMKEIMENFYNKDIYLKKIKILKLKEFIDKNEKAILKGSIAIRLSKHELVLTEILTENVFGELTPEEVASLLSCFTYQSHKNVKANVGENKIIKLLPSKLQDAIKIVKATIKDVREFEIKNGIKDEPGEVFSFNFKSANIVLKWASKTPFAQVLKLPETYNMFREGAIVRLMQQTLELLKEISSAAKVMGDTSLEEKIQLASECIKKGILLMPSLYISQVEI